MKEKYLDAVAKHKLVKVRMMLADELLMDPRGNTFSEMLKYAIDNLPDLFEPDKAAEYEFSTDKSTWNIELASNIKQNLILNFSKEKLALFQEVVMEIGKDKAKALTEKEDRERPRSKSKSDSGRTSYDGGTTFNNGESSRRGSNSTIYRDNEKFTTSRHTLGTVSLCGGAVLTVVAVCVQGVTQTLLSFAGGAAAAAVIVGGLVLLSENKKK